MIILKELYGRKIFIIFALLLFCACDSAPITIGDNNKNPSQNHDDSLTTDYLANFSFIENMSEGENKWQYDYTLAVVEALRWPSAKVLREPKVSINDPEMNKICPTYNQLDVKQREIFWVLLFSSMARHESSYKNSSIAYNDGGGNDSIGLLQLSYEDMRWASSWGCNVDKKDPARQLNQAKPNLQCGVAIMARQITKNDEKQASSKVFISDNVYWSVLDPQRMSASRNVLLTFLKYRDQGASFCKD